MEKIEKYKSLEELEPIIKTLLFELSLNRIKKFEFDVICSVVKGAYEKNAEITEDTYNLFYK